MNQKNRILENKEELLFSNDENNKSKLWDTFNKLFWIVFFTKLSCSLLFSRIENLALLSVIIQTIAILSMVFILSYYPYKISKNKKYLLNGLLGFIWFGLIGIIFGYYNVLQLSKKIKSKL